MTERYSGLFIFAFIGITELKHVKRDITSFFTREVCMDELGCFSAGAPFFNFVERPISFLPDARKSIDTRFNLYTRQSPNVPTNFSNLDLSLEKLPWSGFNPNVPTKFIVHGYISHTVPRWKVALREALLMLEPCNVFYVDWSSGDGSLYEQAVANTRVVGAEIALLIKRLQERTGIKPESIHIIGHSLGSHIAGYVGKRVKSLGRITAMDPAGPYFTNVDPEVRLDRQDALFVDAIHTNVAHSRFQGFGLAESIAHFDFYPNGGHLQPGCAEMGEAILMFLKHPTIDEVGLHDIMCNHGRSIDLFISSIVSQNECEIVATSCDSWEDFAQGKCGNCDSSFSEKGGSLCVPLGINAVHYAKYATGIKSIDFYLNTTSTAPFCK